MRLACFTIKVSSPKERMRTHMLTTNYIESFFHIKEEYITGCYQTDEGLVYEVQLPVTTHTCPYWGQDTTRIKDYRVRAVTLGTIHGKPVNAKYNRRRYFCPHCTHSFSEKNPFVQRYKQISMTTMAEVFRLLHEPLCYKDIARACNVSVTTVIRYCSLLSVSHPSTLPEVLGIDEFRGNAAGQRYQVILTDPYTHNIIDILPKRDTNALCRYFSGFTRRIRMNVKFIVMDMSNQFKCIMEKLFPHAHIVGDRYPICRLVDWALERVRKREQKKLVTHSAMVKSNKRVLMKQPNRLTAQELIKLEEILRVSDDLRNAYRLKLAFRKVFRAWGKERILACIDRWLALVKEADLPEFKNFFVSFTSWKEEIMNAFLLPYSNGYTEGCNNKIKVLKRLSYGLRHFERFRVRILLLSKKNGTDHYRDRCRKRLAR